MLNDETPSTSVNDDKELPVALSLEDDCDLGDVQLTPTTSKEEENGELWKENRPMLVDPWAIPSGDVNAASTATATKMSEGKGETKMWGWSSFRSQWQERQRHQQQQLPPNQPASQNPDEAASVVIQTEGTGTATSTGSATATATARRFPSFGFSKEPTTTTATTATDNNTNGRIVLDPNQVSADDLASFRASRISVTLQKESRDSKWGFGMEQSHKPEAEPGVVRIAVMARMGLLEEAPFQVGDTLVSVQNQKCINAETTIQELVKMEGGVPITLVVETPQGNQNLVQAMVKIPSNGNSSKDLGIGFYTLAELTELAESDTGNDDTPEVDTPEANDGDGSSCENKSTTNIDDPTSQMLRINHIDANGLLRHSVLSQGDIVLAINATPCSHMTPAQAEALIQQNKESVIITAMKPPPLPTTTTTTSAGNENTTLWQRWARQAKRAGIALGGGTMVGVGLIFIPTLPPPFGEVLIVGGVSVLGTEFQGPKRVMRSARDSLERAVGRNAAAPAQITDEGSNRNSSTTTTTGETNTALETSEEEAVTINSKEGEEAVEEEENALPQPPPSKTPTLGDRFKNFGRNHVLPFLDQVVGDRTEEELANNSNSTTAGANATCPSLESTASNATQESIDSDDTLRVGEEGSNNAAAASATN